jgi:phytoene/squalene synthetase
MSKTRERGNSLAVEITKASSKQTYYTFQILADRDRIEYAYRAYAYFRWVDDILDSSGGSRNEKIKFLKRQRELLEASYREGLNQELQPEETLLIELVQSDTDNHPGLRSYLHNMMVVLEIDMKRQGKVISQAELDEYSHHLSVAVMDALLYFIGHDVPPPDQFGRYHAVTAAHIVHLLRDTYEDVETGYYNTAQEYLQEQGISSQDWAPQDYREWVKKRVKLAREYFKIGRGYIAQIKNFRCRLAGFAYAARFEVVLNMIERDNYILREDYSQSKGIWAFLKMSWSTLTSLLTAPFLRLRYKKFAEQPNLVEKE